MVNLGKAIADAVSARTGIRVEYGAAEQNADLPLAVLQLEQVEEPVALDGRTGDIFAVLGVALFERSPSELEYSQRHIDLAVLSLARSSVIERDSGVAWDIISVVPLAEVTSQVVDDAPFRATNVFSYERQYKLHCRLRK